MDRDNDFAKMVRHQQQRNVQASENFRHQSKNRLKQSIRKKLETTMIGAIAAIETKFGFLWGENKCKDKLTERELYLLNLKDELRTEILNKSNSQLRAAMAELEEYDITWERHRCNFEMKDNNDE